MEKDNDALVAYACEVGFYLVNEYGDIVCPHIFADYDDVNTDTNMAIM
jgi:hypothetical protein